MQDSPPIVYALKYRWLTALYDPVVRITTRETTFRRALLEQANLSPGHQLLDVGCGTGPFLCLAATANPGIDAVGLDADPNILTIARRKSEVAGIQVTLDQGYSYSLPYPDNSFDRVVSSLFFHHLGTDDKLVTFREICRVLKPGGELHVADWGKAENPLMRALFFFVQLLDGFAKTADNVCGRLPELMSQAGFSLVRESRRLSTILGTLSLYSASTPASEAAGRDIAPL